MVKNRLSAGFIFHSLRARVTLSVVLPLLLILGIFTTIQYQRQKQSMLNSLSLLSSHAGKVIEDNLRQQMVVSDFAGVQHILDSIGTSEGFRQVSLIDTSGKIIFSPNQQGVGTRLSNSRADCQPCHHLPPEQRPGSIVVTAQDGVRVFRSMNPIENSPECARCHQEAGPLIGVLLTDISTAPFEASLKAGLRETLLGWGIVILLVVLVVNFALSHFVLRRLERFARAINELGHGQPVPFLSDATPDEIGSLASAFNSMATQVATREEENRQLSENLRHESAQRGDLLKKLIDAQEMERQRVARELHDELGQSLSGLALQAEVMQRYIQTEPERAIHQMTGIRSLISETIDRMYELILALRPSVLDDLGLPSALRSQAERCLADSGVQVVINSSGLKERLPPEIETTMYRICQEAINNATRHGHADSIKILLKRRNGSFLGEIEDNGCGFSPESIQRNGNETRGLGLLGMQERVSQFDGQMEIESQPGMGTKIRIQIPIRGAIDG